MVIAKLGSLASMGTVSRARKMFLPKKVADSNEIVQRELNALMAGDNSFNF